jgi:hypothetical protein
MELTKYTERLVPSTRFVAVNGVAPKVSAMSFVAPSASVIGDVTIGKESRYVNCTPDTSIYDYIHVFLTFGSRVFVGVTTIVCGMVRCCVEM